MGLDLLWVVEKEVATRGLGVPVDKRIGEGVKTTDTVSLALFSLVYSVSDVSV